MSRPNSFQTEDLDLGHPRLEQKKLKNALDDFLRKRESQPPLTPRQHGHNVHLKRKHAPDHNPYSNDQH